MKECAPFLMFQIEEKQILVCKSGLSLHNGSQIFQVYTFTFIALPLPTHCKYASICWPTSMTQSNVHPTGDQEVTGSIPAGSSNILS